MGLNDKITAAAKDAEGQLQAATGELTGDKRLTLEGEGKQLQAKVMGAAGDLGDKAKGAADAIGDALKGLRGKGA